MNFDNPLCIYHGGCDDGFGAAWVVSQFLGDIEFYPGVYQKDPPDVSGCDVIMVDFSYKRPVIEKMAKQASSLLILDHHKTAQAELQDIEAWAAMEGIGASVKVVFDMSRSGAGMTWDHFINAPRPDFINYIEDRDLWRKALPGGDEFTIALRSYPQDFETWNRLAKAGVPALIEEGKHIQRYYRCRIEDLKKNAYKAEIVWDDWGVPMPSRLMIANAPSFAASEVAGEIAGENFTDFGACYYFEVRPGEWQYSLRSRSDFDVSAVAKHFGGGGHKGAAGFTASQPVHRAL